MRGSTTGGEDLRRRRFRSIRPSASTANPVAGNDAPLIYERAATPALALKETYRKVVWMAAPTTLGIVQTLRSAKGSRISQPTRCGGQYTTSIPSGPSLFFRLKYGKSLDRLLAGQSCACRARICSRILLPGNRNGRRPVALRGEKATSVSRFALANPIERPEPSAVGGRSTKGNGQALPARHGTAGA